MDALPRIAAVEASGRNRLRITWQDGRDTTVDMTGVIADFRPFAPLSDEALFAAVRVAGYGSGIVWDCGLDYSADSLARLAEDQREWSGEDVAQWQERLGLSNQEAADLLDVALSTFKSYRTVARVPGHLKMACRALELDRALFQARYRPRKPGRPRDAA